MGRRRNPWTEEYIASRERAGIGQGTGFDYQPWITTHSFASRGNQSRIPNPLQGSSIHVMSNIERHLFILLRHRGGLGAYLSQFPLPREVTLACSKTLRIRHPRYPKSSVPVVMTIDALVTSFTADNQEETCAWDVKPHKALEDPRTLEKLSLHRAACNLLGYSHRVFTDQSVPRTTIRSIEWLWDARYVKGECAAEVQALEAHKVTVVADLFKTHPRKSIDQYCTGSDRKNGLPPGTTLRAFKQLALDNVLSIDLTMDSFDIMLSRVPVPSSPLLSKSQRPQVEGGA